MRVLNNISLVILYFESNKAIEPEIKVFNWIRKKIENEIKRLNCKVETAYLNSDWADNENISVKGISGIL